MKIFAVNHTETHFPFIADAEAEKNSISRKKTEEKTKVSTHVDIEDVE